jgi:hypothetical protein
MPAPFDYRFYPSKYHPPIGYTGFEICLSPIPTKRFFDVYSTQFHILRAESIKNLLLEPEKAIPRTEMRVAPGPIILTAHNGDLEEVFCFGGEMAVEKQKDYLFCRFTSTAPVFGMSLDAPATDRVFVEELRATAAKEEAHATAPERFWATLAHIEPYPLFLSSLVTLETDLDAWPNSLHGTQHHELLQIIHQIKSAVRATDGWPASIPTLSQLLHA